MPSFFSIFQDIVSSHVCQSITVLTVAYQVPRGLVVLFDIKNCEVQDVAERAKIINKTYVYCTCLHAEMHIIIKKISTHVHAYYMYILQKQYKENLEEVQQIQDHWQNLLRRLLLLLLWTLYIWLIMSHYIVKFAS